MEKIGFMRLHDSRLTPELLSYHLQSGAIFIPPVGLLCIWLVLSSVTQTPVRHESHPAPIAIGYIVTEASVFRNDSSNLQVT